MLRLHGGSACGQSSPRCTTRKADTSSTRMPEAEDEKGQARDETPRETGSCGKVTFITSVYMGSREG